MWLLLLLASQQSPTIPTEGWVGFGVATPVIAVLGSLLVVERKRADAERQRSQQWHDEIVTITKEVTQALERVSASNQGVTSAVDSLTRAVYRESR